MSDPHKGSAGMGLHLGEKERGGVGGEKVAFCWGVGRDYWGGKRGVWGDRGLMGWQKGRARQHMACEVVILFIPLAL